MAFELDKTDMRLLFYLSRNGRLSYSSLAENIGLSREAVKARVGRLIAEGAIQSFNAIYDPVPMGLELCNVYISFQRMDSKKNSIFEKFMKTHPNVMWTNRGIGKWDYTLLITFMNPPDLYETLSEFKERFKGFLKDMEFDQVLYEYQFTATIPAFFSGLEIKPFRQKREDSSFFKRLEKTPPLIGKERKKEQMDAIDAAIIKLLADNCRLSLSEIGRKIGVPVENTRYRLKRLVYSHTINAFWASVNYEKFGLHWYRVRIMTNKITQENERRLSGFFVNQPNVFWATRILGRADIHIDLRLPDNNSLNEFLSEFNKKFDGIIVDYETLIMAQSQTYYTFTEQMAEAWKR